MRASVNGAGAALTEVTPQQPRELVPGQPVIKIRPPKFWEAVDFTEMWTQREVLYFLIWRDLKARYKQTFMGAAWVVLQPLLVTLVFTIIFGRLMKVPSDGVPYPIFTYAALVIWTFVSNAVLSSTYSLVTDTQIITRVYLCRLFVPAAAIGVRVVDLLVASALLIGPLIYYRVRIGPQILLLPLFVLHVTILVLAVGITGACLNVRFRDVGTVLPIFLQVWMFVSPVVYSSSILPERYRALYGLNPLVAVLNGFRAALFNQPISWAQVGVSAAVTLLLLVISIHLFRKIESSFADEV